MPYHQLKTLLWRNALLKRRGILTTLLEIALPTILIFIIGNYILHTFIYI